ncbi:MAG: hypothetical protein ACRCYU_17255 [Nocardioides sp.]
MTDPKAAASTYRTVWWWLMALSCPPGLLVLAVSTPLSGIVAMAVLSALSFFLIASLVQGLTGDDVSWSMLRQATATSWGGVLITLGLAGYATFFGSGVGWVAIVIAATSPPAVTWALRRHGDKGWPAGPDHEALNEDAPAVVAGNDTPVADMSAEELFDAWKRTGRALRAARSARVREYLVSCRQRYLDEFDHRDPEGVRSWLLSGNRSDGAPRRFLRADRPSQDTS